MIKNIIIPETKKKHFDVFIGQVKIGKISIFTHYSVKYSEPDILDKSIDASFKVEENIYTQSYEIVSEDTSEEDILKRVSSLFEAMTFFLNKVPEPVKPFVHFKETE